VNKEKVRSKFDHLVDNLIGYLETKSELYKIELKEEVIKLMVKMVAAVIAIVLLILCLMFASLSLGHYLNQVLSSGYLGFALIAVGYLLILLVVILLRKSRFYDYFIEQLTTKYFDLEHPPSHEKRS